MAFYSTNEFRAGMKVLLEGDPCSILENEFVKPGKGQAFNRVKLRNLKNGRVWERTFKSGDSLEVADVVEIDRFARVIDRLANDQPPTVEARMFPSRNHIAFNAC